MQIVIDIPEEEFERIKDIPNDYKLLIHKAIANGTPLPKGHGRLKDVDWIDDNCYEHHSDEDGSWCYAWRDIDDAPTIIEADGGVG